MKWCVLLLVGIVNGLAVGASEGESYESLVRLIEGGNAYQRAQAASRVSFLDDARVTDLLIELLADEDGTVRTYAVRGLGQRGGNGAADAMAGMLEDKEPNVRRYAAEGLKKFGARRHVPMLVWAVVNAPRNADGSFESAWVLESMLDAVSVLSDRAPGEILGMLETVTAERIIEDEDTWRVLEAVARCLGDIGDRGALSELERVDGVLCRTKQDYRMWYAVREAIEKLGGDAFERQGADILYSFRTGKITREGIRANWIEPLVKVGVEAVGDVEWLLGFRDVRNTDMGRRLVGLEALGDIGGDEAARVLREYIGGFGDAEEVRRSNARYVLRVAIVSLLRADPEESTAREIVGDFGLIGDFEQEYLVREIGRVDSGINESVVIGLCETVVQGCEQGRVGDYAGHAAARCLGERGGQRAGEVLAALVARGRKGKLRVAAVRALGEIEGYDSVPVLLEVGRTGGADGVVAEMLGRKGDRKAIETLKTMQLREGGRELDWAWIAAALARFGEAYEANAKVVRDLLPVSLEPAGWLKDRASAIAVAGYVDANDYTAEQALKALETMGTPDAFGLVVASMDRAVKTGDARTIELRAGTAGRLAEVLGNGRAAEFEEIATVAGVVPGWFVIAQQAMPTPRSGEASANALAERHGELVRKLWSSEVNRRLDIAADQDEPNYESDIPEQAIRAGGQVFGEELIPVFERIVAEDRHVRSHHGPEGVAKFYYVRSLAAGVLTEKTGKAHRFVDVDGVEHAGGWYPGM